MEKLNPTTLITPKSINELAAAMEKYSSAQLFAGGTFIMSRFGYYTGSEQRDIITLSSVPELSRILHVDRYTEMGSMVTVQQMLNSSASQFSESLFKAIGEISSSVIRRQITIGGALCTPGVRFALPCYLSAVNAQAEIISAFHRKQLTFSKITDKWIPVSKLYDPDGNFIFEGRGFLSKIRIPSEQNAVQIFKTAGSPMHAPSNTVIMSMTYSITQSIMTTPTFCMVFPKGGFFYNQSFINSLSKMVFPLSAKAITQLTQELDKRLMETCKNISELQRVRASRLLINTLYQANMNYFSS